MFQLVPSPNLYVGKKADFLASSRVYKPYDLLQLSDETGQFYFGSQKGQTPKDLLPFQTAIKYHTPVAANATAVLTAAQVKAGVITSTSAGATALTLPTATLLAAALKAVRGTWFDFAVDNSQGASIVTLVVGAGIVVTAVVVTGGATLTTGIGEVGLFRIYFTSATTAKLYRVG